MSTSNGRDALDAATRFALAAAIAGEDKAHGQWRWSAIMEAIYSKMSEAAYHKAAEAHGMDGIEGVCSEEKIAALTAFGADADIGTESVILAGCVVISAIGFAVSQNDKATPTVTLWDALVCQAMKELSIGANTKPQAKLYFARILFLLAHEAGIVDDDGELIPDAKMAHGSTPDRAMAKIREAARQYDAHMTRTQAVIAGEAHGATHHVHINDAVAAPLRGLFRITVLDSARNDTQRGDDEDDGIQTLTA